MASDDKSLYRRNPEGSFNEILKILRNRKNLIDSSLITEGKSASIRNPAWVTITGHDRSCGGGGSMTYPKQQTKIGETYKYSGGNAIKPDPDVESLIVEYAGDHGLARKIIGRIRCYKIEDFKTVQRYFLLPGNEIDIKFGYAEESWGYGNKKSLDGFLVATFSFNTTQDGHWICEFTAVSSAEAIKNLDMQIIVCNGCNDGNGQSKVSGPLKYFVYEFGGGRITMPVKGVAELIAADAQKNGEWSIDDLKDGEVITSFVDYRPGSKDQAAAIVVYKGDHTRDMAGKFGAWLGGILRQNNLADNEVKAANNQVYLSIGYIINRIINDQLLKSMACGVIDNDRKKFNELKIDFHPVFSLTKVPDGLTSGDPLTVLLLGDANYKNDSGEGKNFDADCKNLGAVKSNSSGDITIKNILVLRDVVVAAFNEATKERESNADSTSIDDVKREVVNVIDFFKKIADHISAATGGAINLRIVEDPDDLKSLIVIDQNYGVSDKLNCIVFNPIDGDGSTRNCEVQSNVGSQEYKSGMFAGASKGGDAVTQLRKCGDKLKETRDKEFTKAKSDKNAIIKNPGNLGKNYFDPEQINGLKSAMGRIYRNNPKTATNEKVNYPGLSINLEIDGIWGFIPGNAVSTTQVPIEWRRDLNSYFMVVRVTHEFQQSTWTTSINGILAYYSNIEYHNL